MYMKTYTYIYFYTYMFISSKLKTPECQPVTISNDGLAVLSHIYATAPAIDDGELENAKTTNT